MSRSPAAVLKGKQPRPNRLGVSRLFSFIGCMPLAVVVLGATALASAIGTLLRQGDTVGDYLAVYGPFWHALFGRLSLYHFYSAPWFLAMTGFLLLSVGVCLARNAPVRLRRLWRAPSAAPPRAPVEPGYAWESSLAPPRAAERILHCLRGRGYGARMSRDGLLISAARGRGRNLGYLLTHAAVLLICAGGLVDANPLLSVRLLSERVRPETRDLPASQVPAVSRLGVGNPAFRAHVRLPEQATVDYAFIHRADGYLLQELPFLLTLEEFRIEHYRSGPPRSFASDVTLRDKVGGKPARHSLEVNRPLHYRGYDIYQSDFGDGGSRLRLRLRDLRGAAPGVELWGVVRGATLPLPEHLGGGSLRLDDFRPRNIVTMEPTEREAGAAVRQVDHGASFSYTLVRPDGASRQFRNFVEPVLLQGREYLLSGVREFPGEDFRYLHIPLDEAGSAETFFALWRLLHDAEAVAAAVAVSAPGLARAATAPLGLPEWENLLLRLAEDFRRGGLEAIQERLERTVPEAPRRVELLGIQMRLLGGLLRELAAQLPGGTSLPLDFHLDAFETLATRLAYGADLFLRLEDVELRRASGLIISRAPGRPWVYGGFLALFGGVFLLFYGRSQRLSLSLEELGPSRVRVKLAVSGALPPPADPGSIARALMAALAS